MSIRYCVSADRLSYRTIDLYDLFPYGITGAKLAVLGTSNRVFLYAPDSAIMCVFDKDTGNLEVCG